MKQAFFFIIVLIISLSYSCSDKKPELKKPSFKSFEVAFESGWNKRFALIVDSNKMYLSPKNPGTIYYGILPDSIFKVIDTTFLIIRNNPGIQSTKDRGCCDCSELVLKIISNQDTIRIDQTEIDKLFYPLIEGLQKFIDSSKHQTIPGNISLETNSVFMPPPIQIKFSPPLLRKKRSHKH